MTPRQTGTNKSPSGTLARFRRVAAVTAAGCLVLALPVSPAVASPSAAAAAAPVTVDKQVITHQSTASRSISSAPLTTTQSGELILAFVMSDGSATSRQSFTSVTGGGLTWQLRQRSNAKRGTAEIWQAVASAPVSNLVVTASRRNGSYVGSMVVTAFLGAEHDRRRRDHRRLRSIRRTHRHADPGKGRLLDLGRRQRLGRGGRAGRGREPDQGR